MDAAALTVDSRLVAHISLNGNNLSTSFRSWRSILGSLLQDVTSSTSDVDSATVLSEGGGGDESETTSTSSDCSTVHKSQSTSRSLSCGLTESDLSLDVVELGNVQLVRAKDGLSEMVRSVGGHDGACWLFCLRSIIGEEEVQGVSYE